jgi:flagellar motor switch/type III secretory pathway protein FliN
VPRELAVRIQPAATTPAPPWLDRVRFDAAIVVGRCAITPRNLSRLAIGSLVTLDRPASGTLADLEILGGAVGLTSRAGALVAEVATGYVRRDMVLPDEAHAELTVALGTTQLSLRQITELAVGQVVQLGRPLGGPFELRVAGRVLGRGELVDVDGELAVRIVSLGD